MNGFVPGAAPVDAAVAEMAGAEAEAASELSAPTGVGVADDSSADPVDAASEDPKASADVVAAAAASVDAASPASVGVASATDADAAEVLFLQVDYNTSHLIRRKNVQ